VWLHSCLSDFCKVAHKHMAIPKHYGRGGLFMSLALLASCSATIPYTPQQTYSFSEARDIVEELVLTQHPAWRPDQIAVTEKFISFDYGLTTSTQADFATASAVSTTHRNSGRAYYKYISGVTLIEWSRKFRTWYVVKLEGSLAVKDPILLRTQDLNKAKLLVDALASLTASVRGRAETIGVSHDVVE
jgi:hypothetical protein